VEEGIAYGTGRGRWRWRLCVWLVEARSAGVNASESADWLTIQREGMRRRGSSMKRVDKKQNGLQRWGDHSIRINLSFHTWTFPRFDTSALPHFAFPHSLPSPSRFARVGDVNFRLSPILDGWAVWFLMDSWELSLQERG